MPKVLNNVLSICEVAVDIGTSQTVIALKDDNKIYYYPSLVAIDVIKDSIVGVGQDAQNMLGRAPSSIKVVCPIQNSVIANSELASSMLKAFLKKSIKKSNLNTVKMLMSFPTGATEVEKTALYDVGIQAGAREVHLISESIATVLGEGIDVSSPQARMIINMGAGHIQASVCSFGEVISHHLERDGGDYIDEHLARYMKIKYKLNISSLVAENMKKELVNISPSFSDKSLYMEVKGRDSVDGLPRSILVYAEEVKSAVTDSMNSTLRCIYKACENLSPQISADIISSELILSGNCANLRGLKEYIKESTGFEVIIAKQDAIIKGLLETFERFN